MRYASALTWVCVQSIHQTAYETTLNHCAPRFRIDFEKNTQHAGVLQSQPLINLINWTPRTCIRDKKKKNATTNAECGLKIQWNDEWVVMKVDLCYMQLSFFSQTNSFQALRSMRSSHADYVNIEREFNSGEFDRNLFAARFKQVKSSSCIFFFIWIDM